MASSRTNWPRIRGKLAVGPRTRPGADEDAVGPDHRARVAQEAPGSLEVRPRGDLVRAEVLGEEQIAERVDRVAAHGVDQLAERPALPLARFSGRRR